MSSNDLDKENTTKLLRQTFSYVNKCLVRSGIRSPIHRAGEAPKSMALPVLGDEERDLLDWAETNIILTIRARAVLLAYELLPLNTLPAAAQYSETDAKPELHNVRNQVILLNRFIARKVFVRSVGAVYQRLRICEKLGDARASSVNRLLASVMRELSYVNGCHITVQKVEPDPGGAGSAACSSVKLTYVAQPDFPQFAACVGMRQSELVAMRPLQAGDVIAIEQAHCWVLEKRSRYERCDWCLKDDPLCLFPCSGCQLVMYCREGCLRQAYRSYHALECAVINELRLHETADFLMPLLRSIAMAFAAFWNNFAALRDRFEKGRRSRFVPLHRRNWTTMNRSEKFCARMGESLPTVSVLKQESSGLYRSARALSRAISHFFTDYQLSNDDVAFLDLFVEWHYRRLPMLTLRNEIILYATNGATVTAERKTSSYGWYPLLKLFQPCTNPNVALIDVGPKTKAAIVLRPVAKGTPLTVETSRMAEIDAKSVWPAATDDADGQQVTKQIFTGFNPATVTMNDLQMRVNKMNDWGVVRPPYKASILQDQAALLAYLRAFHMECQKTAKPTSMPASLLK